MAEGDPELGRTDATEFAQALNDFFIEEGIGWQLVDGHIVTRGTEAFEAVVTEATTALDASERPTAARHLHEALRGLSDLADAMPPHVAACIEMLGLPEPDGAGLSKPSVKQHLAALRILFDWLVVAMCLTIIPPMPCAARHIRKRKARRLCLTARKPAR